MKLPFDIATKLILRLVLPGALFSAILWPLITAALATLRVTVAESVSFPVAILCLGWLTLLLDMPIYMVFEGRRYWPARLCAWGVAWQQRRLARLRTRADALDRADPRCTELRLMIREYPAGPDGVERALYPTRMGNLLKAFESYPDRKYGLDGVFAWYRLWVSIDKDLRGELDDQQAIVDSAIYASFGLALAAPVCAAYAATGWLTGTRYLTVLPPPPALLCLALLALVMSWALYHISLHAQAQYGELLAALFDQHIGKLQFTPLLEDLAEKMDDPGLLVADRRTMNRAAVRFLKWHRHRNPGETVNRIVEGW